MDSNMYLNVPEALPSFEMQAGKEAVQSSRGA